MPPFLQAFIMHIRNSDAEYDRDEFEDAEEYVDHKDREQDQTDCIARSVSAEFPYGLQHRVIISITQEHKVSVKYDINNVHDADQHKDLCDRSP